MSTIRIEVVTPTRLVLAEDAEMVIAVGQEGELGILPKHSPLATGLKVAPLRVKANGSWEDLAICGGYLEVLPDKITVLADSAECALEIDVARAKAAAARAQERLNAHNKENVDFSRAEAALKRALTRLHVAGEQLPK